MPTYTLDKVKLDSSESIWRWLAWKLPRRLVMWATVRAVAFATQGKYSFTDLFSDCNAWRWHVAFATQGKYSFTVVPELSAIEALKRWDKG